MPLRRRALPSLLLAFAAATGCSSPGGDGSGPAASATEAAARVGDFLLDARYTDGSGGEVGRRWVHADHGMPVTLLRIQSVPQAFLWFDTPPDSDRGEPHTGEHLLLGKGLKGKMLSAASGASLVGDTAWTSQTEVVYAFNTAAGKDTFYACLDRYLDALLLPDYNDEEVRREVMNLGVKKDGKTGALTLEEKGTIYNEMVSAYERRWLAWYETERCVHGDDHPLSYSSGGEPAAVRTMQPHHIHDFHRAHYHLSANMGMIVALPDQVPDREFLEHLSATMRRLDATPELAARPKTVHGIPASRPKADRGIRIVPYPNANEDDIGVAIFTWAPAPPGSRRDHVLAQILLTVLGEGETSMLYRRLMDTATREVPVDASSVSGWMEVTPINTMAMLALDGLPRRGADPAILARVRDVVRDEVGRIVNLPEGSPALREFNERALTALSEWQRNLLKSLDAPPLFGHRMSGGFWLDHLRLVDRAGGPERTVTLSEEFASVRADLDAGRNPWTATAMRLGLLEEPWICASVASREEMERRAADKAARIEGYEADLRRKYGVDDTQKALALFQADIDRATAALEARDQGLGSVRLVEDVPMDADPTLVYEAMDGAVRGGRGVFDNVSFVETALYFDLHGLPERLHPWLPLLPSALTASGYRDGDERVPYDEAARRRAAEILGLSASYSTDPSKGRHELQVLASGADLGESLRAVEWLRRTLLAPDLSAENLPRLRDLVKQAARGVRTTLGGREENWVRNPAAAVRFQDDRLHLAAESYHAAAFLLARLEFLLEDPVPPEHRDAVDGFLADAGRGFGAADQAAALETLGALAGTGGEPRGADRWILPLAQRLRELLADGAPERFRETLAALVATLREDLAVEPARALRELDAVRHHLLQRPRCRFVLTGSREGTDAVRAALDPVFAAFGDAPRAPAPAPAGPGVLAERLGERGVDLAATPHLGLVWGQGTSGVFLFSADSPGLDGLDEPSLVDALAPLTLGGGGNHGFFMQTWGAGLAYSNGINANPASGRVAYYAERCPDPAETMKFVAGVARNPDTLKGVDVVEYAVTNAVRHSRASDRFEERTRARAEEIEEGDGPERQRAWRRAVLALRGNPAVADRIRARVQETAGRVLPGVGPASATVPGGVFLVLAPDSLLGKWEAYLKGAEGEASRVQRIHPADFWPFPREAQR